MFDMGVVLKGRGADQVSRTLVMRTRLVWVRVFVDRVAVLVNLPHDGCPGEGDNVVVFWPLSQAVRAYDDVSPNTLDVAGTEEFEDTLDKPSACTGRLETASAASGRANNENVVNLSGQVGQQDMNLRLLPDTRHVALDSHAAVPDASERHQQSNLANCRLFHKRKLIQKGTQFFGFEILIHVKSADLAVWGGDVRWNRSHPISQGVLHAIGEI